jgi:hypothetical protein
MPLWVAKKAVLVADRLVICSVTGTTSSGVSRPRQHARAHYQKDGQLRRIYFFPRFVGCGETLSMKRASAGWLNNSLFQILIRLAC